MSKITDKDILAAIKKVVEVSTGVAKHSKDTLVDQLALSLQIYFDRLECDGTLLSAKTCLHAAQYEITLNDETADEWATRQFETEYCAECGKDKEDHDIEIFMGNWFARCQI